MTDLGPWALYHWKTKCFILIWLLYSNALIHNSFNCTADDIGLSFMNSNKTRGGPTHRVQNVVRSTYSSFFRYRVPLAWNKLKANVTHIPTLYYFRNQLLKVLLYYQ